MQEFLDRVPGEGMANRKKITHEDGSVEMVFIENADNPIATGTPLNRDALMAMQGFIATKTDPPTKNELGEEQIIETNVETNEQLITTFKLNGQIEEKFIGEKTITKTITFNEDGSISEVIS